MIQIILSSLIAFGITISGLIGAYNYLPLNFIDFGSNKLGSTITSIAGTDTISGSRSVINTNFSNLDRDKMEVSTTSVASITTLAGLTSAASLATVGTITSGTWSGTAIGVSKGGSGTTSPSTYMVMLGDGSNGLTMASTTGTTGQFLTSNGSGSYPSWQTSAVDTAINYNWTGNHNYTGSTTVKDFSASSTVAFPIKLNGISYSMPSTQGASSTVLTNNGSGALIFASSTPTWFTGTFATTTTLVQTNDNVIEVGFMPKLIKLYYFIQGHTSTGDTNVYTGQKGIAIFNGTTLTGDYVLSDSIALSGDEGTMTVVMQTTVSGTGATELRSGQEGGGNEDIETTLTISAVSATSFTARVVTVTGGGTNSSNARVNFTYEVSN